MGDLDPTPGAAIRYSAVTVDHFQHPRNVGRLDHPDAIGRVDDPSTETTIALYLRTDRGRIERATFRTFGCSACVAASSRVTELLTGRTIEEARGLTASTIDAALGRLPPEKRFCADLVARAVEAACEASRRAPACDGSG